MITRTTELKSGKSIIAYDDIISMEHRSAIYKNIVNSSFKIGWEDNAAIENSSHKYLYRQYEKEEFFKLGILLYLAKTPALAHFDGKKLRRAVLNLSTPSDVYFPHTHKNQDVLLYYANLSWNPHWFGETLFYDETLSEIYLAVPYTPGRILYFDGGIPHALRPQSTAAPFFRFTISMFFEKNEAEDSLG